ncbi:MAG: Rpn family recombination-promoting nuclease/putative transposase [Defluviitaleaceae bacterium]|nr:Rpn family recombination-promoting nuclease/putative transposase [Defluviitaleaceae bacterium]
MPSKKSADRKTKGTKLEYTFKSDVLFKMLFREHQHLLKRLIAVLLEIPFESISQFYITNTEIPPEEIGKKFCRLDINMVVDDKRVNLEIQVEDEGNFPERALFHFARVYSASLPAGENYAELPRTIIISIIDFELWDCEEVHSEFQVLEVKRHTPLTDKCGLHFFELPKMPEVETINPGSEKDLWLALFNAETEEELEELSRNGGAVMGEAIQAYRGVTATEEFRNLEWLRAKTRRDESNALSNARKQERQQRDEHWQGVVAEKDTALANKDAENAELRTQLAELQSQLKK